MRLLRVVGLYAMNLRYTDMKDQSEASGVRSRTSTDAMLVTKTPPVISPAISDEIPGR